MRSAHRVSAHVFQYADAIPLQPVRQGGAHSRMILMVAGALDLHGLAVEEESLVGVPANIANAEADALGVVPLQITARLFGLDRNFGSVEVRSLRRPESRIGKARVCQEKIGR